MFYIMYLTGLCHRRHWPDPMYETYRTRHGYGCTVRVNNREYTTDTDYETDDLARNAAATRAYMICRNFSVNDGMYPGQRAGQGGVIQGIPVAIGTGRRATCGSVAAAAAAAAAAAGDYYDSGSSNYAEAGSGGSSPRISDSGIESGCSGDSRRSSKSSTHGQHPLCYCGRGSIRAFDKCSTCLRELRWHS
ncbi:hypothetical protein BDY21DRAFT_384209 [Lineolata rhizophorae]|uniref:DRBM domain-containing protein n=1 Tax=Lineolata rhizophorae TaxID=578093 RepID=A0A6A6P9I3_9PEZI|nr:hypothetical protein BDY21DRAFT_384209 [Lineolata rhizophorae]